MGAPAMKAAAALLLLLGAAAASAAPQKHATRSLLAVDPVTPAGHDHGTQSKPKKYQMVVTVGDLAPDCVSRKVILINGEFQPKLTFTQGDWVEVTVVNKLPETWPAVSKGISIHWHGFSMKGHAWMDGTKFMAQCPIPRGSSFTYRFQVNEMPGSYFYHDHASLNRVDGLEGPLIVLPRKDTPPLEASDRNQIMFLTDWWHYPGNALAFRLNRPFDPTQATNASGSWCWVGLPRSLLINGKGNYEECEDVYKRVENATLPFRSDGMKAAAKDLMVPNACVAGQLGPTAEPSRCQIQTGGTSKQCPGREVILVNPGSTTQIRIINAASLVYMTVCFEKHWVTVVALDAAPVEAKKYYECVDVNTGNRVDVLLKADQAVGSYWITVGSQYRKVPLGAPSTYAILKYGNSKSTPNPSNIIQPGDIVNKKWNISDFMAFQPNPLLLAPDAANKKATAAYLAPQAPQVTYKLPQRNIDRRFVLQSTQPLLEFNGILRWALDSVASPSAPPCRPILDEVYSNANWANDNGLSTSANALNPVGYWTPMGGKPPTWEGDGKNLQVVDAAGANADVVLKLGKPGAGTHVITTKPGEYIEIVIQNDRAGLFGGEYNTSSGLTSARNGREQHSFHLHGHHFWQVGMGMGEWTAAKVGSSEYNLASPIMRDTTTVLFNGTTEDKAGWVAFRFVATNPGVWPLHCHIAWHEFMGQGLAVIEDPVAITKATVPKGMPTCPAKCIYSNANFNPKAVNEAYGNSKLIAPDNSQLP